MRKIKVVFLALLALSRIAGLAFAQAPALLVVPSKANMLVGDSRTFRAVGKDGRKLTNVRWTVSPENAATLTTANDEATLDATESSAAVVLTAYVGGDSSEATIEIHSGKTLTTGTQIWSVNNLPGCKSGQITQAVPTATGPDLYVEETCPDGRYVRAMTADGREIWRRRLGHETAPSLSSLKTKDETQPADRLNLSAHSICDEVSPGMTKDTVAKLAQDRNLPLGENQQASDSWLYEENGFTCKLQFDQAGSVIKKKKTIQTD
jgi:hypothetical protein